MNIQRRLRLLQFMGVVVMLIPLGFVPGVVRYCQLAKKLHAMSADTAYISAGNVQRMVDALNGVMTIAVPLLACFAVACGVLLISACRELSRALRGTTQDGGRPAAPAADEPTTGGGVL